MSHDITFGVKTSGLIHLLSTTVDQLNSIGYFSSEQTVFIQRYAFKCDDALKAATGLGQFITAVSTRESETFVAYFKNTPSITGHPSSIKSQPVADISAVTAMKSETEAKHLEESLVTKKITSIKQAPPPPASKSELHSGAVETSQVCNVGPVERIVEPSSPRGGEIVEANSTINDVFEKKSISGIAYGSVSAVDDIEGEVARTVAFECVPKAEKIHRESVDKVVVEGSVLQTVDAAPMLADVAVPGPTESIAAVLPTSASSLAETEIKHETELTTIPINVNESSEASSCDEIMMRDGISAVKGSMEEAVIDVVAKLPFECSEVNPALVDPGTDGSILHDAASVGSGSVNETCSTYLGTLDEDEVKPKVQLPAISSANVVTVINEKQATVATIANASSTPSLSCALTTVANGAGNGHGVLKKAGIFVSMRHTGFNQGRKKIKLESRIWDSNAKRVITATTYHHPGATLMAIQSQFGSQDREGVLPFLEIRTGDRFELLEQRSPNIYLVKHRGEDGNVGLVRISCNEMSMKQAKICGCLQHQDQRSKAPTQPNNSLNDSVTPQSRRSSASLEEKIKKLVKNIPATPKRSPQITPKASPQLSPSTPLKSVSPRSSFSKAGDCPEDLSVKSITQTSPAPCNPNAPHMRALKEWQAYSQAPYSEELPERHRFVSVWTPHQTGGMKLPIGAL